MVEFLFEDRSGRSRLVDGQSGHSQVAEDVAFPGAVAELASQRQGFLENGDRALGASPSFRMVTPMSVNAEASLPRSPIASRRPEALGLLSGTSRCRQWRRRRSAARAAVFATSTSGDQEQVLVPAFEIVCPRAIAT